MNIKRIAITLLFVVLFSRCVFAQADNNVYSNLFLFDSSQVSNHNGDIFVFFTSLNISGEINGNIYALFSNVRLNNASVSGNLVAIASQVFNDSSEVAHNYSVPLYVLSSAVFLSHIGCYFVMLALKRSFIEQGALLFSHQPKALLSNGLIGYFACLATLIVFLLSAAGIPLALLGVAVMFCVSLVGQAQISLALGCFLAGKVSLDKGLEVNVVIGSVVWESLKLIPFFNVGLYLFAIPTISFGVVSAAVINRYVRKNFYQSVDIEVKNFDRSKIRDIILKR